MAQEARSKANGGPTPPYIPWKTFFNLVLKMEEGVPSRLDPSWLSTQAGGMHQPIMATFRFFGLTDANNRPTNDLHELAADADNRQERMRRLLESRFDWALRLGDSATHGELEEVFRRHGLTGSTLRKGVRFFLTGAKYAGIPLSRHYREVRDDGGAPRPAGAPARRRQAATRRRTGRRSPADDQDDQGGSGGRPGDPAAQMRQRYFDLLLEKAGNSSGKDDADILDRIEKLLDVDSRSTVRGRSKAGARAKGGDAPSAGSDAAGEQ